MLATACGTDHLYADPALRGLAHMEGLHVDDAGFLSAVGINLCCITLAARDAPAAAAPGHMQVCASVADTVARHARSRVSV